MKANLSFHLDLDFQLTVYKTLLDLSIGCQKLDNKKYRWFFPFTNLEKVKAIVPFELGDEIKTVVPLEKWKGKSGIEVMEFPKLFICREYRKGDNNKVKEVNHTVTKEQVILLWQAIKKQPIDKRIKTSTVAENWVEMIGVDRFHRKSGTFDFAKFFGEREDYFKMYYGIKVLQYLELIKYYKNGFVERTQEVPEIQAVFLK